MVRERAEKVDKLEAEILRYKDKMNDIEFFKSRVEELREDNRLVSLARGKKSRVSDPDPDPLGSACFCPARIRIRAKR